MTLARNFQQHAQGLGPSPTHVTCQIDSTTVFDGILEPLDQPIGDQPIGNLPVAWIWQDSADFDGTREITIAVTGSPVLLGRTLANNPYRMGANVNIYSAFYCAKIGDLIHFDPYSNVTIDGESQQASYQPDMTGQWWWTIPAGSTFTATLNIMPAPDPDTLPPGAGWPQPR